MTLTLLMLAAVARTQPTPNVDDCPTGYERVPTGDGLEPFHCKPADRPQPPFIKMTPLYKSMSCPKGFEPRATPGEKTRYRCVPAKPPASSEPELEPVLVAPEKARGNAAAAKPSTASSFSAPADYLRLTVKDQIQFEYPKDWHVVNGWSDEVPTIYIEFDTGRQGKQVALVVSKISPDQPGFEDMDSAIAHEREYQNAADAGRAKIAGFPARFTALANASRTAYVLIGESGYFTLNYSAPEDLYKTFEPTYDRLLKSFRISKRLAGGS